jgi:hypothetical protein
MNGWAERSAIKGTQTVNSLTFYSEENLKKWMIAWIACHAPAEMNNRNRALNNRLTNPVQVMI